ncbi:hypothetical protein J6590_046955 [Homalodisca vitripennis]|nr:hypothetical protein J6590_046955 [Homalodisca vitripennis]
MLERRADIAVHSMKDITISFPEGIGLAVLCAREDPRDAFISTHYASIDLLPTGAVVGTSSMRRQCQLRERRPDLVMRDLRVGQGVIGIEYRLEDTHILSILAPLHHSATALRVSAERAMNAKLAGGCQVPIGSYAEIEGDQIWLRALVGSPDGSLIIRSEGRAPLSQAEILGQSIANDLLYRGAESILCRAFQVDS